MDASDLLDQIQRDVFSNIMNVDHPRFLAFVPGPSNYVGAMADALASGYNVFAGTWLEASGPTQIELVVVDWLREACGLPDSAGGLFVSGGSIANITALAVARHVRLDDQLEVARAAERYLRGPHSVGIEGGIHPEATAIDEGALANVPYRFGLLDRRPRCGAQLLPRLGIGHRLCA